METTTARGENTTPRQPINAFETDAADAAEQFAPPAPGLADRMGFLSPSTQGAQQLGAFGQIAFGSTLVDVDGGASLAIVRRYDEKITAFLNWLNTGEEEIMPAAKAEIEYNIYAEFVAETLSNGENVRQWTAEQVINRFSPFAILWMTNFFYRLAATYQIGVIRRPNEKPSNGTETIPSDVTASASSTTDPTTPTSESTTTPTTADSV